MSKENKYLDMSSFNLSKEDLFGHYCHIEMKQYGKDGNQIHIFKIVGQFRSNFYNEIPFNSATKPAKNHGQVIDVVNVIHCGVMEDTVYRVPLKDIKILPRENAQKAQAYDNLMSSGGESKVINLLEQYIEKPEIIRGIPNQVTLPKHVIQNALFVFKKQQTELDKLKKKVLEYINCEDTDKRLVLRYEIKQLCNRGDKE